MALQKITLEFGAWEPDQAVLNGQHAPSAKNVVPAKRGYRSFPAIKRVGSLPDVGSGVLAAHISKDLSDELLTAVVTTTDILCLEYDSDASAWAWTSRLSAASTYTERSLVQYGDDLFCLFGGTLYYQTTRGSAFTQVTAPYGRVMGIIRDFLVLGQWSDDASTWYPNGIRWSGIDRPDYWPTPGSDNAQNVQSDTQIFPEGGKVMAIVGGVGGVDGLIFLERAIQRATYVGTPYFFQFDYVDRQQGTIAPGSPVVCGQACYFLSEDGWKATDGASVKPIGLERVDQWFFDNCDASRMGEVRGVHDAQNRLAIWSFPSRSGCPAGMHDRLLIYSYALDRWSMAEPDKYVHVVCSDYARGKTLEDLDSEGTLDSLDYSSLDDSELRTGLRLLGAFYRDEVSGNIYLGSFSGFPLAALVDTQEQGGERMMLHGFRPLVDCGAASAAPKWRILQQEQQKTGTYTTQQRDGICYQHISANYIAASVKIPAETADDEKDYEWTHALGVEALVEPEGWY